MNTKDQEIARLTELNRQLVKLVRRLIQDKRDWGHVESTTSDESILSAILALSPNPSP